jgi:FtsP/CotA-like multicopper oxidase with cupredoxin domain
LVVALGLGVLGGATAAFPGPAAPEGCVAPNRTLTLHAVELPAVNGKVRLAYGLTPSTATIPGPTIELVEGDWR